MIIASDVPTARCIVKWNTMESMGTTTMPPPTPIKPERMPRGKSQTGPDERLRLGVTLATGNLSDHHAYRAERDGRPENRPQDPHTEQPRGNFEPMSTLTAPQRPRMIPARHQTAPFFVCAAVPLIAVGNTTRSVAPKATLIAVSGATPPSRYSIPQRLLTFVIRSSSSPVR
jgi:hypothetical protein